MTHPLSRRLAVALALVAASTATAAAAAPHRARAGHHARTRTVSVNDNWFGPSKLRVHAGDRVRWRWSADAADVHDVALRSGPRGVRRFHSEPLAAGQSFSQRLRRPGRYRIVCTFHQDMTMTITVTRSRS